MTTTHVYGKEVPSLSAEQLRKVAAETSQCLGAWRKTLDGVPPDTVLSADERSMLKRCYNDLFTATYDCH